MVGQRRQTCFVRREGLRLFLIECLWVMEIGGEPSGGLDLVRPSRDTSWRPTMDPRMRPIAGGRQATIHEDAFQGSGGNAV
jgi:hypothetical protein